MPVGHTGRRRCATRAVRRLSLKYINLTVAEILGQKLPNSLVLGAAAFLIASLGGVAQAYQNKAAHGHRP